MRKTSKLLALVLAVLMMLSIASVSVSAQFSDVSVDDEALNDAVNLLTTLKIAYGTTDTTFAPNENVTRQQMAAFVYRLMKAGKQVTGGDNSTPFTDLDDSTFYYMVSWAAKNNIIKGTSATTFNPKGGITLQDAYVMIVRALGYEKETTLPYPIGFIDRAEEIGLDENLPSTLQYTDTLTRGNVAIILANAFYADMNEVTTKNEWVSKKYTVSEPTGELDKDGKPIYADVEKETWTILPTEVTETVAHKIFGVVEETFEVMATSHYALNGNPLYDDKSDVDRLSGYRYDEDGEPLSKNLVTIDMDDLGLTGSSDDYFLAQLTLFVKKDTNDYTKDEFLAAKSNLIKKTATAKDVVLETSTKTSAEYYVGGEKNKTADKVMTGYATFAGVKAYLDVDNAPYSYTTVDEKDSVKFIDMTAASYDEDGNTTYEYDINTDYDFDNLFNAKGTNDSHDKLTTVFREKLPRLYYNGLYDLDVYDIDGDGYAEYVAVKDYQFAQVEVKKNRKYDGLKTKNGSDVAYFNTEDAVITGTYADKDYVLGYFPGKGIAYAEIKEVIKSITSTVVSIKDADKSQTATLKSGEVIEFYDANKKLAGYKYGEKKAQDVVKAGKSYEVYVKDGVLLYKDGISTDGFDSSASYAIVLDYDGSNGSLDTRYDFDKKNTVKADPHVVFTAAGVADGKYQKNYYVNAVIDGSVKAVKLADYAYTHVSYDDKKETYTWNADDIQSQKIVKDEIVETVMYADFYNKFATYTVDSSNAYTFTALDIVSSTDAKAKDIFASKDDEDSVMFAGDLSLKHYTGSIYSITKGDVAGMTKFNLRDYSKVIIKTEEDGDDVYTEYTINTLPKFDETQFTNVIAIFVNNKNSSYENLGILYAEVTDFESKGAKDYRIVTGVTTEYKDGKTVEVVTVLNPVDGTKTTAETASGYTNAKTNDLVEMTEDGKADKTSLASGYEENRIFTDVLDNYDSDTKFMTLETAKETFYVDDSAKILYYTKNDDYEMSDTEILVNGEDNDIIEGIKDTDKLTLYIVAEAGDDKDNKEIVKVKTIIVLDPSLKSLNTK